MVIFLFMIMTLSMEERQPWEETSFRSWVPAIVLAAVSLVLIGALIWTGRGHRIPMSPVIASPLKLGAYVFDEYWFSVEVASFLLFVALVGAMYLGRRTQKKHKVSDSSREAS
jgi:NADH:ubiquinone oxidoreductase subunit 6 (subunit J)